MLVLSRRTDEKIMIGNDIVLTVLEIHHDHVRLGIEAPRSIDVHREEVFRLVQAANLAAATEEQDAQESLKEITPLEPGPKPEIPTGVVKLRTPRPS